MLAEPKEIVFGGENLHPLDNVVWHALTGLHAGIAEGDGRARRYPAAIAPFAAMADGAPESFGALWNLFGSADDRIALVTPIEVHPPAQFTIVRRAIADQMVLTDAVACSSPSESSAIELGLPDVPEMLALLKATQPETVGSRTIELGRYWGIRRGNVLVAMAGEREILEGFAEINAVCVDAGYRGRGFAADLVRLLVQLIVARSETPVLHVSTQNPQAIALYRGLGFVCRRQMHLAVLGRAGAASGHASPGHSQN
jgi:GNAT superfamily N-acetyltransferase